METRLWLLKQHGPVCAYCARRFSEGAMTLDHVTPRRGQTAYDRRDNLVLACPGCNAAKRDLSPVAYLLASRARAANLVRYGAHLSPMLVELARSLAPAEALEEIARQDARDHANGRVNGHANGHASGHANGNANGRANGNANGNESAAAANTRWAALLDALDDEESPYRD